MGKSREIDRFELVRKIYECYRFIGANTADDMVLRGRIDALAVEHLALY